MVEGQYKEALYRREWQGKGLVNPLASLVFREEGDCAVTVTACNTVEKSWIVETSAKNIQVLRNSSMLRCGIVPNLTSFVINPAVLRQALHRLRTIRPLVDRRALAQ
jgi:hypothetical protein